MLRKAVNKMDGFLKHYTVIDGLSVENTDCSHLLEIYGEDFETVKRIGRKSPKRVWTLVDVGLNYLIAIAGLHHVNRINYLITEEEWEYEEEEYSYGVEGEEK